MGYRQLFVYWFVCLFVYLFIYLSVCLFVPCQRLHSVVGHIMITHAIRWRDGQKRKIRVHVTRFRGQCICNHIDHITTHLFCDAMTTLGPCAPLGFIWGSYILFYPTPGVAPFLPQMPIVFWYMSHSLATLLPSVLRRISGALCFGTPLRPCLLHCVSQTLARMDRVERTLLCLHTLDTFILPDQSFA